MPCFRWLRATSSLTAVLICIALLTSESAEATQTPRHDASAKMCSSKVSGFQPQAESTYVAKAGENYFYLDNIKEKANGSISGTSNYYKTSPIHFYTGTFTGKTSDGKIQVSGSKNAAGWSFSFSGSVTCLLSQIDTTDVTTSPAGKLPATLKLTSVCELGAPFGIGVAASQLPACVARQIIDGLPVPGWKRIPGDGSIPYSWGGGHPHQADAAKGQPGNGSSPGPSLGTCEGYTGPRHGSVQSCKGFPNGPYQTIGLDCSGFTRWVFNIILGQDVLGPGGTKDPGSQRTRPNVHSVATPSVGDLVFFKEKNKAGKLEWAHVGILIGPGEIIDEPNTLATLRVDKVTRYTRAAPAYYYEYSFPVVG
jgi:NlpC/P60 family